MGKLPGLAGRQLPLYNAGACLFMVPYELPELVHLIHGEIPWDHRMLQSSRLSITPMETAVSSVHPLV
jgi:hypothetical protein